MQGLWKTTLGNSATCQTEVQWQWEVLDLVSEARFLEAGSVRMGVGRLKLG